MGTFGLLFLILAGLALIGGFVGRRRIGRTIRGRRPVVSDEFLRDILDDDALQALEEEDAPPLDEDDIRKAEDEFWDSEWEGTEDWRG